MLTSQHLTYLGCCMLQAAKNLLDENDLPQHTDERVVMWEPVQECCDQLAVRIGPSRRVPSASDVSGSDNCEIFIAEYDFDLYYSRCVTVLDPQGCKEHPAGDCADVLCVEPDVVDTDCCAKPLGSTLAETDFLARERFVFERYLASEWKSCICEGDTCEDGNPCGISMQCTYARWVATQTEDSGGCAGARLTFTVRYP